MTVFPIERLIAATAVLTAGVLVVPGTATAVPAGHALSPEAQPEAVIHFGDVEHVQRRRRGARRAGRRGRGPRFRARRYRGPRFRFPRPGFPYLYGGYYYGSQWWASDYYAPPPAYSPAPAYGGRCEHWESQCVANWGRNNADFWGCMRYHGCD